MTHPLEILLVEDNPGDAELIREIMSDPLSTHFHFTQVDRLADAIDHLRQDGVQLALLDLGLPDSSGLDTVRRMRRAAPSIPIVVITGHDDEETGIASVKAGAQDYLVKGKVTGDLLKRVCTHAVERHQHQETLRESEQFLRSGLDALSAHIAILAPTGQILAVNRAWREFALANDAHSTDGFIGVNYLEICDRVPGETDAAGFAQGIRAVINGVSETFEMACPCHGPDQLRWFYGRVTPFPENVPRQVVVAHEDITERKAAVNALASSEKKLRLVIDSSPNCVYIKDRKGRYVLVNQAIANLYGSTPTAMIGRTDAQLSANGFWGWNTADPQKTGDLRFKGRQRNEREAPFTLPDGTVHWFRVSETPIDLPDQADCTLGIATDTTEQHQAQVELRNSELRLRTILDAQTSQVVLMDTRMRVLWPNRQACQSAELPRQEIIGRSCHEIWQKQADTCTDCPVVKAIRDGEPYTARRTTPEGQVWRIYGYPVWDGAGRIVSAVEVAENITDRITLEDQLRQAQKMESLGTLAGGIAHDFNNILTAILGYTELAIEKSAGSEDLQNNLKEVYQAGRRATELVRQILTFSRRTDTSLKPLQIGVIIKEALKLLRSTMPSSIEIHQRIDRDLDPVLADPTQIHQIIMNLCTNAGHAMEPAGGTLTVNLSQAAVAPGADAAFDHLEAGQYLALTVGDTGCGMSPEIIASIFDPYFTTKDLGEGTGLGLSVVHGIIKEYGGDITVSSTPGQGSTFRLYFPTVKVIGTENELVDRRLLPRGSEHILVVDDEPPILKINSQLLERQGYRVTTENDSLHALERFKKDPGAFDLVLSDVTMPRLTGDRLAVEIMAIRPDIPVILCTGYSRLISEQSTATLGIRALITKPVVKKTLLTEIRRVLDEGGGQYERPDPESTGLPGIDVHQQR